MAAIASRWKRHQPNSGKELPGDNATSPRDQRGADHESAEQQQARYSRLRTRSGGVPKRVVTDGPLVTFQNSAGIVWMQNQFLL